MATFRLKTTEKRPPRKSQVNEKITQHRRSQLISTQECDIVVAGVPPLCLARWAAWSWVNTTHMYTMHNTYTICIQYTVQYTYTIYYNTHKHSRCRLFASSRTSLIGVNSWSRHGNRRRWLITSEMGNLALRRCALLSCCFAQVILARVRRKHKVKMTKSITTVRCTF